MSAAKTTLEILVGARALIVDPKHWTQNVPARDANGEDTNLFGADAVCFCSWGAVRRIAGPDIDNYGDALYQLNHTLPENHQRNSVIGWQDIPGRTHAEVLALFDKAIAAEQAAA